HGASLASLVKLGKEKGYELICVLHINAFFVDSSYYPCFEIEDNSVATLRTDLSVVTYLFSGYDGTIFLAGHRKLPWHGGIPIRTKQLPWFLRKYHGDYGPSRKVAFALCLLLTSPREFFRLLQRWNELRRSRHSPS